MPRHDLDIVGQLGALRRYAKVLVGEGAADDLVQSTFLRAHERRRTFADGADPRVWLMSIMHNLFVDERRSLRASEARDTAFAEALPAFSAPSAEMAAHLSQLRQAFLTLPSDQREALHLVALEGLTVAEAAAVLHVPAGTVMSRVGRARAALRDFEAGKRGRRTTPLRVVGGRDDRRA